MKRLFATLLPLLCLVPVLHGAAAATPAVPATPAKPGGSTCHLPGAEEGLRCFEVPSALEAAQPNGPSLTIHVTVAPAYRQAAKPDPLFILAGGPGEAGSDVLPLINVALRRVRATRDIVFIDQRGTGLSGKLACPDQSGDDAPDEAAMQAEIARCAATLNRSLAPYTTRNAAHDLEQVRLALGYGQVNLFGGSYGTRLAQAYARAYPGSVRAMILDGVAAPEQIIPAAGHDGQAALDAIFARCAKDRACGQAFPQLRSEFATLLERVNRGGVVLDLPQPRTGRATHITLNNSKFVGTVHSILYSASDSYRLPFLIHSAYLGNWQPFMARALAGGDYAPQSQLSTMLLLAVVCAEDVPRLSPAAEAEDSRATFMAGYARRIGALCPALKVAPAPYPAPTSIAAPALLLSGGLDPVTPPRRADSAARYMPHAQRYTVANVGHGVSQLGCAPRLLREFLDQPLAPLKADCLKEIPSNSFLLDNAGPHP